MTGQGGVIHIQLIPPTQRQRVWNSTNQIQIPPPAGRVYNKNSCNFDSLSSCYLPDFLLHFLLNSFIVNTLPPRCMESQWAIYQRSLIWHFDIEINKSQNTETQQAWPHILSSMISLPAQRRCKRVFGWGGSSVDHITAKKDRKSPFPSFTFNDAFSLSSRASQGCACLSAFETSCIVSGKVRAEVMGNCNSCFTFQSAV